MLGRLRARWADLLAGFWFVPGAIALAFGALAWLVVVFDRATGAEGTLVYGGTGPAARTILQTIATSMATVAGVAFSITIVTLQLVSGQFSPRTTRAFLADRVTQVAAGVFVGIFLYCLIAVRAVRDETGDASGFVPGAAVTGAIALGVVGLATLLVFINRIAQSIKVDTIASGIARAGLAAVDRMYPEPFGRELEIDADAVRVAWRAEHGDGFRVLGERPGYVQAVRLDELARALGASVRRLELRVAPGDFVTERTPLAVVWPAPADADADAAAVRPVRRAVTVAAERDVGQDVGFALVQLSDVALRALSPSVNDPTTAITCIGYLTAVLERLARRGLPSPLRRDEERELEILAARPGFDTYVRGAYEQVGRAVAGHPWAAEALLEGMEAALRALGECRAERRAAAVGALARELGGLLLDAASTAPERAALVARLDAIEVLARGGDRAAEPFTAPPEERAG